MLCLDTGHNDAKAGGGGDRDAAIPLQIHNGSNFLPPTEHLFAIEENHLMVIPRNCTVCMKSILCSRGQYTSTFKHIVSSLYRPSVNNEANFRSFETYFQTVEDFFSLPLMD